jgi:outer membrane protein assembly factor BamB
MNAAATPPVVAGGVVYVSDASGRRDYSAVYALAADTGACLWQSPAGFAGEYPVGLTVAPGEPPPPDSPAPLRTVPLGKGR